MALLKTLYNFYGKALSILFVLFVVLGIYFYYVPDPCPVPNSIQSVPGSLFWIGVISAFLVCLFYFAIGIEKLIVNRKKQSSGKLYLARSLVGFLTFFLLFFLITIILSFHLSLCPLTLPQTP